jgi:hypothetical protein
MDKQNWVNRPAKHIKPLAFGFNLLEACMHSNKVKDEKLVLAANLKVKKIRRHQG